MSILREMTSRCMRFEAGLCECVLINKSVDRVGECAIFYRGCMHRQQLECCENTTNLGLHAWYSTGVRIECGDLMKCMHCMIKSCEELYGYCAAQA